MRKISRFPEQKFNFQFSFLAMQFQTVFKTNKIHDFTDSIYWTLISFSSLQYNRLLWYFPKCFLALSNSCFRSLVHPPIHNCTCDYAQTLKRISHVSLRKWLNWNEKFSQSCLVLAHLTFNLWNFCSFWWIIEMEMSFPSPSLPVRKRECSFSMGEAEAEAQPIWSVDRMEDACESFLPNLHVSSLI